MKLGSLKYFILFLLITISCSQNKIHKRTAIIMGTTIEVQIRGENQPNADQAIDRVFKEIRSLDTLFSTFLKDNPTWKLNHTDAKEIVVNDEMFSVLKKCDEYWKLTGGIYDAAIGNVIDLVGFEKGSPHLPSSLQVKTALEKTGWKHVKLIEPNIVVKPTDIKISFNACIPGYAADKAATILTDYGIKEFLINTGGEIFAKGNDWKVGIQHPRKKDAMLGAINAGGIGIATSGDYQQFFKQNGKKYTHIFNPNTGMPADQSEAVTIIAKDAITADALSTAVFILGPKKGIELIERLSGVEGMVVDTTGAIHYSSGFEKYLTR